VCELVTSVLLSLLGLGPITRLYDRFALPTPPELKGKFETVDDNGKIVHIPHCVAGLRVWEPDSKSYEAITPHLDGTALCSIITTMEC